MANAKVNSNIRKKKSKNKPEVFPVMKKVLKNNENEKNHFQVKINRKKIII